MHTVRLVQRRGTAGTEDAEAAVTPGNIIFIVGAILESWALTIGVDSRAVGVSMIGYGVMLLVCGYLR
jgi:hypothetical protein